MFGSGNFSNLRIRLLFKLGLPSIQTKFTHAFTWKMTMQIYATAETEKWLRIWVRLFTNFDSGSWTVSETKTQNPAGVDSESIATSGFLLIRTLLGSEKLGISSLSAVVQWVLESCMGWNFLSAPTPHNLNPPHTRRNLRNLAHSHPAHFQLAPAPQTISTRTALFRS